MGVLCDTQMPIHRKGKVHRTMIRLKMLYKAKAWTVKRREISTGGKRNENGAVDT